ncbi:hypothetical protein BDZ97DRAFT_2077754 [Flammula alnicola]|nr:hypothetical protein BDZ97DRAFT_2077754 [Flammula alnicola]
MDFQPNRCTACCPFAEDFEPAKCAIYGPGNPCDICLQISEMDAQIAHARALLADLGPKRQQLLKTKVNTLHDPVTRYLPVEVASLIFIFYVHGTDSTQLNYTATSSTEGGHHGVPLVLAAVCKAWRRIVFATPRLWTSMNIDLSIAQDPALQVELATQWLSRSGHIPLSISVDVPLDEGSQQPNQHTRDLFELVKTYAFRWQELTLFIPRKFYHAFTDGLEGVPLLESLTLIPTTWDDIELDDELAEEFALTATPCLKDLAVLSLTLNQLQIQMDNLTSLWYSPVGLDEIFEILSHSTQLKECTFASIQGSTNVYPFPDVPIIHSSLGSLSISLKLGNRNVDAATSEELDHIFDLLELPSLQSFSHTSTSSDHPLAVRVLSSLFARSHILLKHLSISVTVSGAAVSEHQVIWFLEKVPTLITLSITLLGKERSMITDIFFKRLARVASTEVDETLPDTFLPHLEILKFRGRRSFSWQSFADIFPAPGQGSSTIQSAPFVSESTPPSTFPIATRYPTRRPLQCCELRLERSIPGQLEYIGDKHVLISLVGVQKTGVVLSIVEANREEDNRDMIECSLDLFRSKRENL